jgi:hypothetical protein
MFGSFVQNESGKKHKKKIKNLPFGLIWQVFQERIRMKIE